MSPVIAFVVMLVVCALGCRAELDLSCVAFTGAMKDVAGVLECYSDTAKESLQINKLNSNSLQSLSDTVHLLKKQMSLENEKTLQSMKQEFQGLIKVGTYQQEIQELKAHLERKDKEVEQLATANEDLAANLADNGKLAQDLDRRLQESQMRVQELDGIAQNLNLTVQNLEERLSVSVQQVDILTEKEKIHNGTVQDLNKRLQESELRVDELGKMLQKLNNTSKKEEVDQDPECKQPQLKKIQDVVQKFNSSKDLTQLRADLESALDSSSLEHRQLQSVERDDWFTYWLGSSGHTQLVTLLLCAGLPVDTADSDGDTMLHGAAQGGQVQMVKLLLEHGAEVDARDWKQHTPLIRAAYWGRLEVVKVLVEAGASTTARNHHGRTALEAARYYSRTAVAQYLQPLPH